MSSPEDSPITAIKESLKSTESISKSITPPH